MLILKLCYSGLLIEIQSSYLSHCGRTVCVLMSQPTTVVATFDVIMVKNYLKRIKCLRSTLH